MMVLKHTSCIPIISNCIMKAECQNTEVDMKREKKADLPIALLIESRLMQKMGSNNSDVYLDEFEHPDRQFS